MTVWIGTSIKRPALRVASDSRDVAVAPLQETRWRQKSQQQTNTHCCTTILVRTSIFIIYPPSPQLTFTSQKHPHFAIRMSIFFLLYSVCCKYKNIKTHTHTKRSSNVKVDSICYRTGMRVLDVHTRTNLHLRPLRSTVDRLEKVVLFFFLFKGKGAFYHIESEILMISQKNNKLNHYINKSCC